MIIDLIFASDSEIEDQGYSGIQWTGNTLSAETTVMISDGQTRVIREIASPIFNKSGKLAGAIESITDITGAETTGARTAGFRIPDTGPSLKILHRQLQLSMRMEPSLTLIRNLRRLSVMSGTKSKGRKN